MGMGITKQQQALFTLGSTGGTCLDEGAATGVAAFARSRCMENFWDDDEVITMMMVVIRRSPTSAPPSRPRPNYSYNKINHQLQQLQQLQQQQGCTFYRCCTCLLSFSLRK
jgi:hypothetical protein